jgi:hypothetical protein
MRRTFFLVAIALMIVHSGIFEATAQLVDRRMVHAFLAKDDKGEPATTFAADVLNIYLIWKGEQLQPGDEIRVVWIAEDIGKAGPEESKIGERSIPVHKPNEDGSCFISRPHDRVWPVGKYRTEIYIGKRVVAVLRFTIQPGANIEVH